MCTDKRVCTYLCVLLDAQCAHFFCDCVHVFAQVCTATHSWTGPCVSPEIKAAVATDHLEITLLKPNPQLVGKLSQLTTCVQNVSVQITPSANYKFNVNARAALLDLCLTLCL